MTKRDQSIVVLGLGNTLCSDDGLGVRAAELLAADPRLPAGVHLVDGGTRGLDLLGFVAEADRLLVLDAVEAGAAPGTLVRLERADLLALPGASDAHRIALADLLNAAALLESEPAEVVLLGLQPQQTCLGTALSAPVSATMDGLVEVALRQLEQWASQRGSRG